jgi:hypothetical protein
MLSEPWLDETHPSARRPQTKLSSRSGLVGAQVPNSLFLFEHFQEKGFVVSMAPLEPQDRHKAATQRPVHSGH